jgi:hypothetical protein
MKAANETTITMRARDGGNVLQDCYFSLSEQLFDLLVLSSTRFDVFDCDLHP